MQTITPILVGAFGSLIVEVAHWYQLRHSLTNIKYIRLFQSKAVWCVTVLMIFGSGIGTWLWYSRDGVRHLNRDYLITGAAFPLIIKKGIRLFLNDKDVVLGENEKGATADYFGEA